MLTLKDYADAKKLSPDLLRDYGLYDGTDTLRIPYFDRNKELRAVRMRMSLDGVTRFRWRQGDKPLLYGLWMLPDDCRFVFIVEGESDCHTLWAHGLPALGVPGASTWKKEWARYIPDCRVYVVDEKDEASKRLAQKVVDSLDRPILRVRLSTKDVSELYVNHAEWFWRQLRDAMDEAEAVLPDRTPKRRQPHYDGAPVNLERLVERLNARKVGNQYAALCPFHPDRKPSLYIHPEKGYYCFGCGKGGSLAALAKEIGI